MSIFEHFNNIKSDNVLTNLNQQKNLMANRMPTTEEVKNLVKHLQNEMYGEEAEKLREVLQLYLDKRYNVHLNDVYNPQVTETYIRKNIEKALNEKQVAGKTEIKKYLANRKTTEEKTVRAIIEKIQGLLYYIEKNEQIDVTSESLKKEIDTINKFIKGIDESTKKTIISEKDSINSIQSILVGYYNELIKINNSDKILSKIIIGDTLEYAIGILSCEHLAEIKEIVEKGTLEEVEEEIIQYIENKVENMTVVGGKAAGESKSFLSIKNEEIKIGNTNLKTILSKNLKDLIPSFNEYNSVTKQGKTDIVFQISNNQNKFKISAKNWSNTEDFNSYAEVKTSNLAYSLARVINRENLYAYMLQLGYKNYDKSAKYTSDINNWHIIAKQSVILDSLIGVAQVEGYADTFIINDRAKKEIVGIPMRKILNIGDTEISKIILNGYNKDTINKTFSKYWQEHQKDREKYTLENNYFKDATTYLAGLAVQLRYNQISKYAFRGRQLIDKN